MRLPRLTIRRLMVLVAVAAVWLSARNYILSFGLAGLGWGMYFGFFSFGCGVLAIVTVAYWLIRQ